MRLAGLCALSCMLTAGVGSIIQEEEKEGKSRKDGHYYLPFKKLKGNKSRGLRPWEKPYFNYTKRDDGYEEMTIENEQSFYSVELGFGTPSQNITVLVDTGSSDLWVPSVDNVYCSSSSSRRKELKPLVGNPKAKALETSTVTTTKISSSEATIDCSEYGTFDSDESSTWSSNDTEFYISYADGTFSEGEYGTDTVVMYNSESSTVTITDMSFAVANYTDSEFGVLGIGLTGAESTYSGQSSLYVSSAYQYDNFPVQLVNQGFIEKNAYSVFLNDLSESEGSILFGGVDHNKYTGTLYTIPMVNALESYGYTSIIQLTVTLQGLGLSTDDANTTITETMYPALLDTGTTLSYFPSEYAAAVADAVGATYSSSLGYYLISCDDDYSDYELVFDFGGFQINAPLTDFIFETSSTGSTCVFGVVPQSDDSVTLGDVFLSSAYVVFDLDNLEVSLAQASFDNTDSDIDVITSTVPSAVTAPSYSSTWSTSLSFSTGGDIFTITTSSGNSTTSSATSSSTSSSSSSSKTSGASFTLKTLTPFYLFVMLFTSALVPLFL